MRNLKARLLVSALLLLGSTVISAQDATEEPPAAPRQGVGIVAPDETVTAALEDGILGNLWAFRGSQGDVVTIELNAAEGSFLDPYVVLLGARGEVYAENDDDGEEDFDARIAEFELPSDGGYFVLATTFDNITFFDLDLDGTEEPEAPEAYELTIGGFMEPAGTDADAAPNPIEDGETISRVITPEAPVFLLSFQGLEGQSATITTSTTGDDAVFDTLLYLFDPSGNWIAFNDDQNGFDAEITDLVLPADGQYLIFATSYDYLDAAYPDWESGGELDVSLTLD